MEHGTCQLFFSLFCLIIMGYDLALPSQSCWVKMMTFLFLTFKGFWWSGPGLRKLLMKTLGNWQKQKESSRHGPASEYEQGQRKEMHLCFLNPQCIQKESWWLSENMSGTSHNLVIVIAVQLLSCVRLFMTPWTATR